MKAKDVQMMLDTNLKASRGPPRTYLGMSNAGLCPRAWYWRTTGPRAYDVRMAFYGLVGYALEAAIVRHLGAEVVPAKSTDDGFPIYGEMLIRVNKELTASFDDRYKGHIDHELADGTLVECKSVTWAKFLKLQDWKTAADNHIPQVQAYMRHGEYEHAVIIYVPRDIDYNEYRTARQFPFYVVDVKKDNWLGARLEVKARKVLAAMDAKEPPQCTCKRCKV